MKEEIQKEKIQEKETTNSRSEQIGLKRKEKEGGNLSLFNASRK
ncbi:hypothetical protein IGJ28_001109 [Enterococcus sp. AZ091]